MQHLPPWMAVTEPLVSPSLASMEILEGGEAVGTLVPPEVVGTSEVRARMASPNCLHSSLSHSMTSSSARAIVLASLAGSQLNIWLTMPLAKWWLGASCPCRL